jgi:hypothetical protein
MRRKAPRCSGLRGFAQLAGLRHFLEPAGFQVMAVLVDKEKGLPGVSAWQWSMQTKAESR